MTPRIRTATASTLAAATLLAGLTAPAMAADATDTTAPQGTATVPDMTGIMAALKNVTVEVDGKPYTDFTPLKGIDVTALLAQKKAETRYTVPAGSTVEVKGVPAEYQQNVTSAPQADGKGVDVTASLGGYTIVYHFDYENADGKTGDVDGDGKYTTADLKDVTATITGKDGNTSPLDGFDPSKPDVKHTIPADGTVTLDHLPDGWKAEPSTSGTDAVITVTGPDGATVAVYTFAAAATGTDQPGKDDAQQGETTVIDLAQAKDALGIVATDGAAPTPKDNGGGDHTVADTYVTIRPGHYKVTLKADEAAGQHGTASGTWYSASATSDTGVFGSAFGSTHRDVNVAADWYKPADGGKPATSIELDMPSGSFINMVAGAEHGSLVFTRTGDAQGEGGDGQTPDADRTPASTPDGGQTQTPDATRDKLPQTGVSGIVMGIVGALTAMTGAAGTWLSRRRTTRG